MRGAWWWWGGKVTAESHPPILADLLAPPPTHPPPGPLHPMRLCSPEMTAGTKGGRPHTVLGSHASRYAPTPSSYGLAIHTRAPGDKPTPAMKSGNKATLRALRRASGACRAGYNARASKTPGRWRVLTQRRKTCVLGTTGPSWSPIQCARRDGAVDVLDAAQNHAWPNFATQTLLRVFVGVKRSAVPVDRGWWVRWHATVLRYRDRAQRTTPVAMLALVARGACRAAASSRSCALPAWTPAAIAVSRG